MNSILEYKDLSVTYPGGVEALKNVNFKINRGEFIVIVGLSGAGKSTLLRATNRLVEPTGGKVIFNNKNVTEANKKELRNIRSDIGMIFQGFNLNKRSSVFRNVMAGRASHLPTWRNIFGVYPKEDKDIIFNSLDRVNILEKAYARADELSGGQQQRVGIARALAQEPQLMLADEPVASLDPPTSHMVMKDLQNINRELGITVIVNLHFIDLAKEYGERIIGLNNGEVVYDGPADSADRDTFEMIYGRSITAEEEIGRDRSVI